MGPLRPLSGNDSPELKRDLETSEAEARAFHGRYLGTLAALSGAELGAAIARYERLQETLGRVMSYASLVHATDMSDPEIGPLLPDDARAGERHRDAAFVLRARS